MKVLLFGSVAAGKTTLAKRLVEAYPRMEYLAIDDFRRKYSDASMEQEQVAKQMFVEAILPAKDQIIEASGLGQLGNDIRSRFSAIDDCTLVVTLFIDEETVFTRLKSRQWDIPFPGGQEKLDVITKAINRGVSEGDVVRKWSEREHTYQLQMSGSSIVNVSAIVKKMIESLNEEYGDTRKAN